MLVGLFHVGAGCGNQLFRYVTTRVLAEERGFEFGMVSPTLFKGHSFMTVDLGKPVDMPYIVEEGSGKVMCLGDMPLWEEKGFQYNPEINYLEDNTIIDGSFEDSKYWEHRLDDISEWLKVEPLHVPDDTCVIGFRGGEYYTVPELGLPKEYYWEAMDLMQRRGVTNFQVHTDDLRLAKEFFPNYECIQDIGINWRSIRYAKNAIIANSSFYVLPRLLSKGITISPRYWNRYNTKKWEYPQNYYKAFIHI